MTSVSIERRRPIAGAPLLVTFFAAAVAVRVGLTGPPGFGASPWPGVLFGVLLGAGVLGVGTSTRIGGRVFVAGAVATAVLVLPALAFSSVRGSLPIAWFPAWLAATLIVAPAEEAFLRGVLYDAVSGRWNADAAIVVAAIAFGMMHVPFYGWQALPLDTAVGVVLGVARLASGTWVAPAIAHTAADVAGWWMV
jgi:membrane protease YdiL (CAAX protease family)